MHNGYIFMMQYVRNLEDQVLADNYVVGKEIIKDKKVFDNLLGKLYLNTLAQRRLANDYEEAQSALPEQKHNLEWMKGYVNLETNSNEKV